MIREYDEENERHGSDFASALARSARRPRERQTAVIGRIALDDRSTRPLPERPFSGLPTFLARAPLARLADAHADGMRRIPVHMAGSRWRVEAMTVRRSASNIQDPR